MISPSDDNVVDQNRQLHSSFLDHINYSCGSCGYQLNLNSGNRNTSAICSKYGKLIKKGIISFFCVDESRFIQVEKLQWIPNFSSKLSWGLFRSRTKLFCRKCGNHVGISYKDGSKTGNTKPNSISWDGISDNCRIYDIKISALQPSASGFGL
ncbi:hypothetical protein UlMin_037391 [Ulmus minor]